MENLLSPVRIALHWSLGARSDQVSLYLSDYRSALYPNLNPILAADTTLVRFDVKKRPLEEIQGTTFHTNRQAAATMNSTTQIRLFSKSFPWSIDIKSTTPITCEDVWEAIYTALQAPLADSEWGMIIGDKDRKVIIETAMGKREGPEMHMKRVDWLGDNTMFKGLEQDEDFQKARLFPGTVSCSDTYIVKLGIPV
jgi:hypothetical protein